MNRTERKGTGCRLLAMCLLVFILTGTLIRPELQTYGQETATYEETSEYSIEYSEEVNMQEKSVEYETEEILSEADETQEKAAEESTDGTETAEESAVQETTEEETEASTDTECIYEESSEEENIQEPVLSESDRRLRNRIIEYVSRMGWDMNRAEELAENVLFNRDIFERYCTMAGGASEETIFAEALLNTWLYSRRAMRPALMSAGSFIGRIDADTVLGEALTRLGASYYWWMGHQSRPELLGVMTPWGGHPSTYGIGYDCSGLITETLWCMGLIPEREGGSNTSVYSHYIAQGAASGTGMKLYDAATGETAAVTSACYTAVSENELISVLDRCEPGAIIVHYGTGINHMFFFLGRYADRQQVINTVVGRYKVQREIAEAWVTEYPADDPYVFGGGKYWILEAMGSDKDYGVNIPGITGVRITNSFKGKSTANAAFYITSLTEKTSRKASLSITKMGEDYTQKGEAGYEKEYFPAAGAVFALIAQTEIYSQAGELVLKAGDTAAEGVTGEDGCVIFEDLWPGKYIVQETGAPQGLLLGDGSMEAGYVQLTEAEADKREELVFYDQQTKVDIAVHKTDAYSGRPLSGAEFGLYAGADIVNRRGVTIAAKGELIESCRTDSEGKAAFSSNLPCGTYIVKEISSPEGYLCDEREYTFTAEYAGQNTPIVFSRVFEFRNTPVTYGISLQKADSLTGGPQGDAVLEGAVYHIYAAEDILSPDGSEDIWVKKGERVRDPGSLEELELKTDREGKAYAHGLYPGRYYLLETTAPDGYLLDTSRHYFNINENAEKETFIRTEDNVIGCPFVFVKTVEKGISDDETELLKQASFVVLTEAGAVRDAVSGKTDIEASLENGRAKDVFGNPVGELRPDREGKVYSPVLPFGDYVVAEYSVPQGCIPAEEISFSIRNDGVYVDGIRTRDSDTWLEKFVKAAGSAAAEPPEKLYESIAPVEFGDAVENHRYRTRLCIVKKDASTGNTVRLPGTAFEIYRLDRGTDTWIKVEMSDGDERISELVCSAEGMAYTPVELECGIYRVVETKASDGYYNGGEKSAVTLEITQNGAAADKGTVKCIYDEELRCNTVVLEYFNEETRAKISIYKTGEMLSGFTAEDGFIYEMRGLQGAVFEIYAEEDIFTPDNSTDAEGNRIPAVYTAADGTQTTLVKGALLGIAVTDENGYAYMENMLPGCYRISEKHGPEGFGLCEDRIVRIEWCDQYEAVIEAAEKITDDRLKCSVSLKKYQRKEDGSYDEEIPVEGAEFTLYNTSDIVNYRQEVILEAGSAIETAVTGKDGGCVFYSDIPVDVYMRAEDKDIPMYYIRETKAAPGYVCDSREHFFGPQLLSGDRESLDAELIVADDMVITEISKKDMVSGEELPGAELVLTADSDIVWKGDSYLQGEVLDTWISTKQKHTVELLPPGIYILREVTTPFGYQRSEEVRFEVGADNRITGAVMYDDRTRGKLMILKLQEDGNGLPDMERPMEGVEFRLLYDQDIIDEEGNILFHEGDPVEDAQGRPVILETDAEGRAEYEPLEAFSYDSEGRADAVKYRLEEAAVPAGYVKQDPVHFEFEYENDCTPVVSIVNTIVNTYTKVEISKKDAEEGFQLPGARLCVKAAETIMDDYSNILFEKGETVREWVTQNTENHYIRVPAGKYILSELQAPAGYVRSEDIEFEVRAEGSIQSVVMVDLRTMGKIRIIKTDEEGESLEGAVFEIRNGLTGEVADTVETDENGIAESCLLPIGSYNENGYESSIYYTVKEIRAPDGYAVDSEEKKVSFVQESDEQQELTCELEAANRKTRVYISKKDAADGKELEGARLTISAAQSVEYDGKIYEKEEVILSWTSGTEPVEITGLPAGDYILTEVSAPEGYLVAESVVFTVDACEQIKKVTMVDERKKEETTPQETVRDGSKTVILGIEEFRGGAVILLAGAVLLAVSSLAVLYVKRKKK